MKKLLLLAAAMFVAVACNNTKPDPNPDPKPDPNPVGEPVINLTKIEKKRAIADTINLIVGNFTGTVEISTKNPNFNISSDSKTTPGVIILQSFTYGETEMYIKCGEKTFTIPAKFEQFVIKSLYTQPLIPFGKNVDEVIALEVARGNDGTPVKSFNKDKTFYTVDIPVKTPNEYTKAEKLSYHFPVENKSIIGLCIQSTILSQYGTEAKDEDLCVLAHCSTTESNYYVGVDPDVKLDCAVDREFRYITIYQAGQPGGGIWSYQGHYLEYSEADEAPSKALFNAPIYSTDKFTPSSIVNKYF